MDSAVLWRSRFVRLLKATSQFGKGIVVNQVVDTTRYFRLGVKHIQPPAIQLIVIHDRAFTTDREGRLGTDRDYSHVTKRHIRIMP